MIGYKRISDLDALLKKELKDNEEYFNDIDGKSLDEQQRIACVLNDWLYGGQIILLIILGIICAYVSNVFLKKNIQDIAGNFASWL